MTCSIGIEVLESLGCTLNDELRASDVEDPVFDLETTIKPFARGADCCGISLAQIAHEKSINATCYIERPWHSAKRHIWLGFGTADDASFERLIRAAVRLGFTPPLTLSKRTKNSIWLVWRLGVW